MTTTRRFVVAPPRASSRPRKALGRLDEARKALIDDEVLAVIEKIVGYHARRYPEVEPDEMLGEALLAVVKAALVHDPDVGPFRPLACKYAAVAVRRLVLGAAARPRPLDRADGEGRRLGDAIPAPSPAGPGGGDDPGIDGLATWAYARLLRAVEYGSPEGVEGRIARGFGIPEDQARPLVGEARARIARYRELHPGRGALLSHNTLARLMA